MRSPLRLAALAALLALAACQYPQTTVQTLDERPQLTVRNATAGMMLFVNGVAIGPADAYDGKQTTLELPAGNHLVEIRQNGRIVHSEQVYLALGTSRSVTVTP